MLLEIQCQQMALAFPQGLFINYGSGGEQIILGGLKENFQQGGGFPKLFCRLRVGFFFKYYISSDYRYKK